MREEWADEAELIVTKKLRNDKYENSQEITLRLKPNQVDKPVQLVHCLALCQMLLCKVTSGLSGTSINHYLLTYLLTYSKMKTMNYYKTTSFNYLYHALNTNL